MIVIRAVWPFIILMAAAHACLNSASGEEPIAPAEMDAGVREAVRKLQGEKADERLAGIADLSASPQKAVPAIPHLIKLLGEEPILAETPCSYPWIPPPPGAVRLPTPAEQAARLLIRIGEPAVPPLIAVLGDDNALLRGNAAWVLGQIGDPRAAEPVLKRLHDEDAFVRRFAVLALGRAKNWEAGELLRAALKGSEPELRGLAAVALGRRKDEKAVDALIGALVDTNSLVQEAAAWALGEIRNPKAMDALLAHLKAAPSRHVIAILGRPKEPRAVEPIIALLGHKDQEIRMAAAQTLGGMEDRRALESLVASLKDQSPWVRTASASALGRLDDARAVEPLMELLKGERIEDQSSAAEALGHLKARPAVELLITLLEKDAVRDRRAPVPAVLALGEIGDRRAVGPLIDLLKYKEPYYVRDPVVLALGQLKDSRAVEPLIDCLKDVKDDDPLTYQYYYIGIGHALRQLDDPRTMHHLEDLAKSGDVFWRCGAVGAYGGIGAVEPLLKALSDDEPRVRRMAVRELGEMSDARVFPALKRLLLTEKDEQVIAVSKWALWTIEVKNRKTPLTK